MNFREPNTDPWGRCNPHCMDQLTVHLRRKSVIPDRGTIGTSPRPTFDDGVEGRTEVHKVPIESPYATS